MKQIEMMNIKLLTTIEVGAGRVKKKTCSKAYLGSRFSQVCLFSVFVSVKVSFANSDGGGGGHQIVPSNVGGSCTLGCNHFPAKKWPFLVHKWGKN